MCILVAKFLNSLLIVHISQSLHSRHNQHKNGVGPKDNPIKMLQLNRFVHILSINAGIGGAILRGHEGDPAVLAEQPGMVFFD